MFCDPLNIAALLKAYPGEWWICGGWAIDLFLDRETRVHKDVDIAIPRKDQLALQDYLLRRGWTLDQAIDGKLIPWQAGEFIQLPAHTIWCRHRQHEPDFLEILLNEVDGERFAFRRNQAIQRSRAGMALRAPAGIPILAPEIVLLYKASSADDQGNSHDFFTAWPALNPDQRHWLQTALRQLYTEHPWLADARTAS